MVQSIVPEDVKENSQKHNTLDVEYKGHSYQIPTAENTEDANFLVQSRLKPQLAAAMLLNGRYETSDRKKEVRLKTGIAFVEYIYQIDEQSMKTKKTLGEMGVPEWFGGELGDEVDQFRRPGLHPQLHTMVNGLIMKDEPDQVNYDMDVLPFENRTFVIGPMIIDWEAIDKLGKGPSFEEDEQRCKFYPKGSFAIDGKTLMEVSGFKRNNDQKITNTDVTLMLTKIGAVDTN